MNYKNNELNGSYGMWVSIHVGVQSMFSARLRLGSWEKINCKDSALPYLLRFGILKLSFGYKFFICIHYCYLKTSYKTTSPLNILQNAD